MKPYIQNTINKLIADAQLANRKPTAIAMSERAYHQLYLEVTWAVSGSAWADAVVEMDRYRGLEVFILDSPNTLDTIRIELLKKP